MLPPQHRMRRAEDFTDAVRGGARSGTSRLVVHLRSAENAAPAAPRAGLVVSKAVGNAVERNQVKRRLRGLLASRISALHDGEKLVVRALPAAREASSSALGADLDTALSGARRRGTRR
ncbi:ribonuclease P protein component [Georgenia satyanarayanai]|uniref:ribonuclease P protein component n=1 Tax=Georgenia satyanarayanai TaxID=860221 RepID=UPI002041777B|nr:ribonuclease P protein component [Georgenia satyanarayanai]MCM3661156.1 ribonuclease P protein component [Georgenia satyanarayanai]